MTLRLGNWKADGIIQGDLETGKVYLIQRERERGIFFEEKRSLLVDFFGT